MSNFVPIVYTVCPELTMVNEERNKTLIKRDQYLITPVILNRSHLYHFIGSPGSSSS